jgi:hypothetical protein
MGQEPAESSAGEMMVFGLIEQADRMGKSAQGTQRALTAQIEQLAQLQRWAEATALELQKRAEAAIKNLEAERVQLQRARAGFEHNALVAMQDAMEKQSAGIERQAVKAMGAPLSEIQQAATQVRQIIKDANWLFILGIFLAGLVIGLMMAYFMVVHTQNAMDDRLDKIEQFLSTPAQPVPAAPEPHSPAHKGKAK